MSIKKFFRCTPEDDAVIQTNAAEAGLEPSSYMRLQCIGKSQVRHHRRVRADWDELRRLLGAINRIGNLINQLVRHLHRGGIPTNYADAALRELQRAGQAIDISKLLTVDEGKREVKARLPKAKRKSQQRIYRGGKYRGSKSTPAKSWKSYGVAATSRRPKIGYDQMQPEKGKGGKTGKGDGSGGGAASTASALKSSTKPATPPVKTYTGKHLGKGNGPERRHKKMWVAVERREQGPK